jgi:hypothetical protein
MFSLAAVMFATFMGFFMSMTLTFCMSIYLIGFSSDAMNKWLELWPVAYPIAVISIIVYRPLALYFSGKVVRWWQSRHHP